MTDDVDEVAGVGVDVDDDAVVVIVWNGSNVIIFGGVIRGA
jgi:hypothetical protein